MGKIRSFAVLVCVLAAANAWGAGFFDDFNRFDGAPGNGWTTETNGTVTVEIVDNEVFIAGTEATAWARCGIVRPVANETRVSFDFKAADVFNVHIHVESADNSAWIEFYAWAGGPFSYANSTDGSWPAGPWTAIPGSDMVAGQYNTLVLEKEGANFILTLNGKVVSTVPNATFTTIESVEIASDADAGQKGSLHIDNVLIGKIVAGVAKDPSPANSATDVPYDVAMSWTPGEHAVEHDVYLGTAFEDVNAAARANPGTVLAGRGQAASSFQPAQPLEYGQTYYWRVDEVNAAPDNTIFKGDIWSFTVEPFTYPVTPAAATASSAQPGMGPQNTINGSGLSNDLHSTEPTHMWTSTGAVPNWIQFEFDKVYKLDKMLVWNSNQLIEAFVGFGAKDVKVEYSADGQAWTQLEGVPEFARALAAPAYAANTTVNLGVTAKFVKLTINSNWGGIAPQVGLAEVRFLYVPVEAREPQPAAGATGIAVDTELSWRPGREAESHQVYLGTDQNALALADTVTDHRYAPASLNFATTYFWKVNEIGGGGPYESGIWSLTTQEYETIDDMEGYNDDDQRIYEAWIDGLTTKTNGSQVGYSVAPFAETNVVHGGGQAMPFLYDNQSAPFFSEAEREFEAVQNWTTNGADTLNLWVRGAPVAYVEDAGKITMSAAGHDIWDDADDFRFAYKTLTGDGSVLVKVESLTNTNAWAKAGVMIRQSLDANSKFVYFVDSYSSGVSLGWRPTVAAACGSATQTGVAAPQWVKLIRKGDVFTAQYSADGKAWLDLKNTDGTIASTTVAMSGPVYAGLCVTSHNTNATTVAVMSGAAATGNVTGGSWTVEAIGDDPQLTNAPANLYVTLQDSAGKSATATNATAVTSADWTQWKIPLTSFTGVNAGKVKKMLIGVDNRAASNQGGTGTIYIDDIGFGRPLP